MAEGVKECLELLDGVGVLAKIGKDIAADGKISLADLSSVLNLVREVDVIVDAVKGVASVPKEVKDLDGAESAQIVAKVLEIVNKIRS